MPGSRVEIGIIPSSYYFNSHIFAPCARMNWRLYPKHWVTKVDTLQHTSCWRTKQQGSLLPRVGIPCLVNLKARSSWTSFRTMFIVLLEFQRFRNLTQICYLSLPLNASIFSMILIRIVFFPLKWVILVVVVVVAAPNSTVKKCCLNFLIKRWLGSWLRGTSDAGGI